MFLLRKLGNNKLSRDLSYKMTIGICDVLVRFSQSTGITDVNELVEFIKGLSVDEFCDFKFKDVDISTEVE